MLIWFRFPLLREIGMFFKLIEVSEIRGLRNVVHLDQGHLLFHRPWRFHQLFDRYGLVGPLVFLSEGLVLRELLLGSMQVERLIQVVQLIIFLRWSLLLELQLGGVVILLVECQGISLILLRVLLVQERLG